MFTLLPLALRNLRYFWASNIPVFLGVMLGAAVLTGALLVGDSLRGSLRARTERQLNGVGSTFVGTRMIREQTAGRVPETMPVLLLSGSGVSRPSSGDEKRAGRVTILGLRDEDRARFDIPGGVVISATVAERLGVKSGDTIELGLQRMAKVPRSSLLGQRDVASLTRATKFKIDAVLPATHPMNDFNLTPNPLAPLNVFVPLKDLQTPLDIVGRVNALLTTRTDGGPLNEQFHSALDLSDWGLRVEVAPVRQAYIVVESEQLILDEPTVAAIEKAATAIGARSERTLTYMANGIYPGTAPLPNKEPGDPKKMMAYSVIAALDPAAATPLGPFSAEKPGDGILLLDWPDAPMKKLKLGDPVTVAYFKPEMEAEAVEAWHTFPFRGYVPLAGAADDPNLTPPFPGITDKPKIRGKKGEQWDAPFEINYQRIGAADEDFWENHRATPKAYISPEMGRKLFGSRFGSTTSIRVAPAPGKSLPETAALLRSELPRQLDPASAGLKFEPTRERMLQASRGGTDFGAMLLAFSFLLILASLLLVGLLMRVSVGRRAKEIGLLLSAGYTPKQVGRMLQLEGSTISFFGALAGLLLAWFYARGMLALLAGLWPDAGVQSYLRVHIDPLSLLIGFELTMAIAWLAIWLSLRGLIRLPVTALLRGETNPPDTVETRVNRRRAWIVIGLSLVLGLGLVFGGSAAANADQRAGAFFGGGLFLMLAGLWTFRLWLRRTPVPNSNPMTLIGLGLRNASRAGGRSLLTAMLLALATFLLVAVESFRKKPDAEFLTAQGGSGGYRLIAESDVPVFQRFDREPGRGDLLDQLQKQYGGSSNDPKLTTAKAELDALKVMPFRLRGGDDASCLNLYQAGRPRVLGASNEFLTQGRFAFAMTTANTGVSIDNPWPNPWLQLNEEQPDGAIPVIADQNTVLWQLKTFVGGSTTVPDENGRDVKLRIVGTLQDSLFPSELLMSDANFRKLYPHEEGYRYFLVEAPPERIDAVAALLETGLQANGMQTTRSADLVAAQQAVIGAYLSTFQLLGGLALLLGMFGFGVVILRNVNDRTGEFALLRATGFQTGTLQKLVLIESGLVLTVGVGIGLIAAVISVIPNLALGGQVASVRLGGMLVVIIFVGVAVAYRATSWIARLPVISSLRRE